MRVGEIRQFCRLQDEGQSLMRAAMSEMNLSVCAYHRILKLARTIADLAGISTEKQKFLKPLLDEFYYDLIMLSPPAFSSVH